MGVTGFHGCNGGDWTDRDCCHLVPFGFEVGSDTVLQSYDTRCYSGHGGCGGCSGKRGVGGKSSGVWLKGGSWVMKGLNCGGD
ncbi:hypothetical protein SESBI_47737 [Sesbania bispinosa]|nr:hypothetical protein SESBI_47737 [Sesbania bispinosa]